jgi:alkanesulfonate monooxygenase SsuD/methylene tetrahydromethanopterin reductase-like flavin-dependent oxidoreductase (luciferase family)
MRIALGLPSRIASASGELILEWLKRAEEGPFSSVVVTDRVVSQALEPLAVLALAAGATRRVRLMSSVLIGPTRETTLLARQAATIDALSGGRLTLGIGIGVRENDYLATGFDFHRRGRRVDEQLPLLRRLWAGEPMAGELGPIGPQSRRPGGPELLIGGYVQAIVRRIAAWGDGYMAPGGGEPEVMMKMWRQIEEAWRGAGRAGDPRWVGATYFALGPDAAEQASGILTQTTAIIRNWQPAGCAAFPLLGKMYPTRSSAKRTWASMSLLCVLALNRESKSSGWRKSPCRFSSVAESKSS